MNPRSISNHLVVILWWLGNWHEWYVPSLLFVACWQWQVLVLGWNGWAVPSVGHALKFTCYTKIIRCCSEVVFDKWEYSFYSPRCRETSGLPIFIGEFQRKLSCVPCRLDWSMYNKDKVQLLGQTCSANQLLGGNMETLLKNWFIDFEFFCELAQL
jgi:hypothetical protein